VALAGHRYVVLLHGLQQRRLGLGLARLISSAIRKLGEDRPLDEAEAAPPAPELSSKTSEPMMSEGIRSGVNWMRLASSPAPYQRLDQQRLLARPARR